MKQKIHYIIIKFTPNDNIKSNDDEFGWVDYFAQFLKKSISYQLDTKIEIIYKAETEILTAEDFNHAAIIFYILSPAMVFASNINQDAAELEQAFNFDIPFINAKVKKVFKAPVKIEDLPLSLSTPTYYRFYDNSMMDDEDYETYEGWNNYQENDNYWKVFADVLHDTINILEGKSKAYEKKVFISDQNVEYFEERNIIKRELKAFNAEIYPDEDFSIEANYMEDSEMFFMKKCDLALHFPDEFIKLDQEERNKTFEKLPEIKRMIWFNPIESVKPEKKAKYNELKVQLKPYTNIEAVESTIEELKDILKETVFSKKSEESSDDLNKKIIYIISDSIIDKEINHTLESDKEINQKFDLKIISNVQNVTDYRHLHYQLLKKADYFYLVYFKKNEAWLRAMTAEIRKAPGFRNDKNIMGKFIIASKGLDVEKQKIEGFEIFEADSPAKLIGEIKKLQHN